MSYIVQSETPGVLELDLPEGRRNVLEDKNFNQYII